MEGLKPIGRSSVHECQKRLKPQKKEIKKRSQGSNDPESNWCQADFLLSKQMCIHLNHIKPTDEDPPMPTKNDAKKVNDVVNPENILTEKTTANANNSNIDHQNNVEKNSNEINEGNKMDQLTEEMKNLLLKNSPQEFNTVEDAVKFFIEHCKRRWENEKSTLHLEPLTPCEKIAFKFF